MRRGRPWRHDRDRHAVAWFARHETRLAWRDWAWLLSGGRRRRGYTVVFGLVAFVVFMHGLAYLTLARSADLAAPPDKRLLVTIGGTLLLYWSLMLSQAMEAVTRAFYARGDLELILSSPASASRLFAVRIGAMALSIGAMALILAAPAINVLAWLGGTRWLAAYGVVVAMAIAAVAISVLLTIAMFRCIGPKRTRLVAQIVAAVIGASFVIGVQFIAILSVGTLSRVVLFQSEAVLNHVPARGSLWWLPIDAVTGNWPALIVVLAFGVTVLAGAIRFGAPRFGELALAANTVSQSPNSLDERGSAFRPKSPGQALRRKEWTLLLWRDPWLMSQSLMQLLYLLPPFFLLSRMFYGRGHGAALLVPVLVMAAGQLAGGLAWLAISGEDAPDLIASAPVTTARVWRAKAEGSRRPRSGLVFGPIVILLAVIVEPILAATTSLGIAVASCVGDDDPVLVPRAGQAQLVSSTPRLIAHRHLRRSAVVDNLGRRRRPRRYQPLADGRRQRGGARYSRRRVDDQSDERVIRTTVRLSAGPVLDLTDGYPKHFGRLARRHAIPRPGANSRKLRPRDPGRHRLLRADRGLEFLGRHGRRGDRQYAGFAHGLAGRRRLSRTTCSASSGFGVKSASAARRALVISLRSSPRSASCCCCDRLI